MITLALTILAVLVALCIRWAFRRLAFEMFIKNGFGK